MEMNQIMMEEKPIPKTTNKTLYRRLWISFKFMELRWLFGGQCWFCGSKMNLEFAHILPTGLSGKGRGMRLRYYDILKHPLHYALLCSGCHDEFDAERKSRNGSED